MIFHLATNKLKLVGILLSQTMFLLPASAASIDFEDKGTYFTDNISGLDWLDVTASINQSYGYVKANMVAGGEYAGWRYASGLEFYDLVAHYTDEPTRYERYNTAENTIDGLVEMLGSTLDSHHSYFYGSSYDKLYGYDEGKGWDYTYGFIADTTPQGEQWLAMLYDDDLYNWRPDVQSAYWGHHKASQDSYSFGSYLVRDSEKVLATPLPAAFWFFSSGLVGIMGLVRKNKNNLSEKNI